MNRSAIGALCAAAFAAGILPAVPASAQTRLQSCNAEWNAMKANNTVGDKKYADFRKECLARTAAAPAAGGEAAPATPPAPKAAARTAAPKPTPAAAPASPPGAANAVFPTGISDKYSSESPGRGRMHTCRDQYQENKATSANGGLNWIQKGGGYYSECNKRLKGEG